MREIFQRGLPIFALNQRKHVMSSNGAGSSKGSKKSDRDLDLENSHRGVWLVKVPLSYIFSALFRDTSLACLLSRRARHICHVTCVTCVR